MANEDEQPQEPWKAPYMSYETLSNFLDKKIGENPIPPRIDTYFLDNYAGSVRPLLIATLKTIGMIDENNHVLEPMRTAARSPESRKAVLKAWAEPFYPRQIALGEQHATAQMLWESFSKRGFNGSTLRRAVLFYLALAKDVELPVSVHFKAPKASTPSSRSRNRVDQGEGRDTGNHARRDPPPRNAAPEEREIHLGEAGTVTVLVDVRWLDLPDAKFTKLRQIIRELEALEDAGQAPEPEEAR